MLKRTAAAAPVQRAKRFRPKRGLFGDLEQFRLRPVTVFRGDPAGNEVARGAERHKYGTAALPQNTVSSQRGRLHPGAENIAYCHPGVTIA
jgi:hypothetical protein